MLSNPTQALFWYCWRRTRHAIAVQLLSVIAFGILYLLYFAAGESEIIRNNAVTLTAFIGSWLLSAVMSSWLAQSGSERTGFGFAFNAQFHLPISNFQLTAIPLIYCVGISYICFLLPAVVLTVLFNLSLPPAMVHFMLLEYFLIVLSLSWFSSHGPESIIATVILLLCFYFELLIPEFTIDEETSLFIPGSWSSITVPALIVIASVSVLFLGVKKQRSGENLVFHSGRRKNLPESLNTIYWYRFLTTRCPTTSGRAALIWRLRQSRGLQAAVGMGATTGAVVLLVLYLLQLKEYSDADWILDEVLAFSIIAFCTVFTAALASMFGLSFRNGVARLSVFDRTQPLSTAEIVAIRITVSMLCLLVAGVVQFLFIGLLGPLIIENFGSVRAEFFESLSAITERGAVYTILRGILAICLIYIFAVLWAVSICWFSMRTRLMSIALSSLTIYSILAVAVIVALDTDGQTFLRMSNAIRDFHLWIIMTIVVGSIFYLFSRLIKDEVITNQQMIVMCAIGFALAAIQIVILNVDSNPGGTPELTIRTWDQVKGLLPLFATVLALWTQQKLRHE